MHADAHFVIGHDHVVCQDYATWWNRKDGTVVAAIADGCSSAPDTDVGARLLVLLTKISLYAGLDRLEEKILDQLPLPPGDNGLDWRAYRATLGIVVGSSEGADVRLWGDGVIIAVRHTGEIEATAITYTKGAPPYLAYKKIPAEIEAYRVLSEDGNHVISTISCGKEINREMRKNPNLDPFSAHFPSSEYKMVAVCSDGIQSIYTPNGVIPVENVIDKLGSFPNTSGEFVVRKIRNGLPKLMKSLGSVHGDDVSMAAIVLDGGDS